MKNEIQGEEFTLLRAGISDQANILAEDELSEILGGAGSNCDSYCFEIYCTGGYCERDYIDPGDDPDDPELP